MSQNLNYELGTTAGKKTYVRGMFDSIAKTYDLLNHLLSMGIDFYWRKVTVKKLNNLNHNSKVLDLATGTGDLAIQINKKYNSEIYGTDIAKEMLRAGLHKIAEKPKIKFFCGDAEKLPYKDNFFDTCTIAFGIRNCENVEKALTEMKRVTRPNGQIAILEFSQPENAFFKQLYLFYFKNILPLIGNILSKHNDAYKYLPESVMQFPHGQEFYRILQKIGFTEIELKPLTFGIVTVYTMKV